MKLNLRNLLFDKIRAELQPTAIRPFILMTLLVKNEADIIEQNLLFHHFMGIDKFIVTDNNSTDGTLEILKKYKEKGWITDIIEEYSDGYNQKKWVHRMIKLAKKKYKPTWIINADADEFWYSPLGSLKEELCEIEGNISICSMRNVYPDASRPWQEWEESITPVPQYFFNNLDISHFNIFARNIGKVVHKAKGYLQIHMGNHKVSMLFPQYFFTNIIVYHYIYRGREHFFEKVINGGQQLEKHKGKHGGRHWRYFYKKYKEGVLDGEYDRVIGSKYIKELRDLGWINKDCPIGRILKNITNN